MSFAGDKQERKRAVAFMPGICASPGGRTRPPSSSCWDTIFLLSSQHNEPLVLTERERDGVSCGELGLLQQIVKEPVWHSLLCMAWAKAPRPSTLSLCIHPWSAVLERQESNGAHCLTGCYWHRLPLETEVLDVMGPCSDTTELVLQTYLQNVSKQLSV